MLPKVSIQIPTYNQKKYIKEALVSALAQTYENLHIIVSDDCSPDYDIFEFLSEYKDNPKVFIHRNDKNLGRVGNYRNTLYHIVEGEWFVNLDGDDYFTNPNFIQTAIESIEKTSQQVSLFQADAQTQKILDNNMLFDRLSENTLIIKGLDYLQNIIVADVGFTHASILYNVDQARASNFYKFDTLDIDYFSYIKMFKAGYAIFWNEKVYQWRQHSEQETHRINFAECKMKFSEYNDLVFFYNDTPVQYKKSMLQEIHFYLTIQLMNHFFRGKITYLDFIFMLRKMKFSVRYLNSFLSIVKDRSLKQNYLFYSFRN